MIVMIANKDTARFIGCNSPRLKVVVISFTLSKNSVCTEFKQHRTCFINFNASCYNNLKRTLRNWLLSYIHRQRMCSFDGWFVFSSVCTVLIVNNVNLVHKTKTITYLCCYCISTCKGLLDNIYESSCADRSNHPYPKIIQHIIRCLHSFPAA